jgi:hypothetical protein
VRAPGRRVIAGAKRFRNPQKIALARRTRERTFGEERFISAHSCGFATFHRPAARFEQYIEHIYRLTAVSRIKSTSDPCMPIYLSMLMLEYADTLVLGRARERAGLTRSPRDTASHLSGL